MNIVVFISCFFASLFNASSSYMEREAAKEPGLGKLFSKKLTIALAKNKKFISGIGFQLLASLMEIIALSQGSLVLVGPLLTLDIVLLWLIISYKNKLTITKKNWLAVFLIVGGLVIFTISTHPKNTYVSYSLEDWLVVMFGIISLIISAYFVMKKAKSARLKAGVLGLATATNFALNAGLVKLIFNQIKLHGIETIIVGWPLYVLLIFAAVSVVLTQNTFHAGPLVISQPIIEIFQAVTAVFIGIYLFNGVISTGALSISADVISAVFISFGIIILASIKDLFNPN